MSATADYIKNAVFFAQQKPENLANVLTLALEKENLSADIELPSITVYNGTELATIKASLPTTITGSTSKGVPFNATVSWGADTTPTYAKTTAGTYVLEGTLTLPAFITNTGSKKAKISIVVNPA